MSEPFSFDEFNVLVDQIRNSDSSEEPTLSTKTIETLDSMTRYFYSKDKESRGENNDSNNAQNNLTTQTILDSAFQLMNIYRNSLQMLSKSFVVDYSPKATEIIEEISQTLKIDPALNLTQQILIKMENKNDTLQDENNDNVAISRSKLSSVLKVSSSSTEDEIIKAIQNQKQISDSQSSKSDIGLFEMPNETLEKQVKNDILKEHVAELEKSIRAERKEKSDLSDKVNNLNMKIITLERKVDDYEHTIAIQKAQIEDQNELSAPQQEGIYSLQKTIHTLSSQLELQNQDISDLSKQKENLVRITEKQSSFINALMKEAEKMNKIEPTETPMLDSDQFYSNDLFDRILEITATISSSCVDNITDIIHDGYDKSDYEKIIEIVSALIDDIRSKQESINKLQSTSNPDNTNNNVHSITGDLNEPKSLLSIGLAKKIMVALNHEISFVEKIASSKSDRMRLKPEDENDETYRASLEKEAKRAHSFLKENCSGIIEDFQNEMDVFEALSLEGDPLKYQESLKTYLDSYPQLVTDEGQALMTILRHASAAVSVLYRYGFGVKDTTSKFIEKLQNQIKADNIQIEKLTRQNEDIEKREEEISQKFDDMKDLFGKTLNILQSAAIQLAQGDVISFPAEEGESELENTEAFSDEILNSQSYALKTVLEAIDHIRELPKVKEEDYQKSIENKLIETLNDLEELRNSRMNEIAEYENRSFSLRDQAEKDIQRQKIALEKQKVAFENASDEIKQLKIDIQLLTDSLHESQKNNQELQEKLNGSRVSTRDVPELADQQALDSDSNSVSSVDLASNNAGMKKEMRKLEKKFQRSLIAIHVQEKEKRKGIKQKLHKLRDENESLVSQINERDRQIKILQNTQEQLLADHKNRSSRLRESEIQEQKNISRLKAQLNDLNMKLATTEMARKVAEQQLKSLEEKSLRRENDTKSIQDILKQEYSTRLEEKANAIREECNAKHNEFVKQIVQEFRTCFDILPTITSSPSKISVSPNKGQFVITADLNTANAAALEEVAMKLVKTASESIKYYSTEKKKNKKQFKELQALFNASSPLPTEVIKSASSYVNNTKSQIDSLQKQLLAKKQNGLSYLDSAQAGTVITSTPSKVMSPKDWENWARKLYMWSNRGQSTLLSIQAIMKSVEESVLEASGSNKASKKNDILRTEKSILLNNDSELLFPSLSLSTPIKVQSIVKILTFVRRAQKVSGTLPSNMALLDPNLNDETTESRENEDQNADKISPQIERNRKQSLDDYDFKEEQEVQRKLQQFQNQENLTDDEAAIDAIIEEEEEGEGEGENQQEPQVQNEHGEEQ